jgi:hypothetical protein
VLLAGQRNIWLTTGLRPCLQVDIVIDETYWANYCKLPSAPQSCDVRSITGDMFTKRFNLSVDTRVAKENHIYRLDGTVSASMGGDWWIRGLLRVDLVSL